jgi:2-amino-4-hydroxy-6-hydroxymethyldihydropteridine diphosphokinase
VKTRAVLALGSNLGERESYLNSALEKISELPTTELIAVSSFLETTAVTEQGEDETKPIYLNAVSIVQTELSAQQLHQLTSEIETELGRVREGKWQDRTLDIDLVSFGDLQIETKDLTLPHPRAFERIFVLKPWLEIDSDAELAGHGKIAALLAKLER